MKRIEAVGRKFGRLLVVGDLPSRAEGITRVKSVRWLLCRCDCGNEVEKRWEGIRSGLTESCGCLNKESIGALNLKHGEANKTKENRAWQHIRARCYSSCDSKYKNYGARGIRMCDRWLESYETFLEDMGRAPSPKHSIERLDVNGDYEPDNCVWADSKTQGRNTTKSVRIEYKGEIKTMVEWAEVYNIPYKSFHALYKYKGMSIDEIISKYS